MWGIPLDISKGTGEHRITPTRVGNTSARKSFALPEMGSPPPVWGIRNKRTVYPVTDGITPTRVGNTIDQRVGLQSLGDHPHPCGEYFKLLPDGIRVTGSPPPVWGIPFQQSYLLILVRITPTRVGNTARTALKNSDI